MTVARNRPLSPAERRAHARYTVGFGADVHTKQGVIAAGTRDVSRGGCQLASGQPIEEGTTVQIDLSLTIDGIQEPGAPRMSLVGRIQWSSEGEDDNGPVCLSGVRFENMTAAQATWLEKILIEHGEPAEVRKDAVEDIDIDIDVDV